MAVKKLGADPRECCHTPVSQSSSYRRLIELECDEETKAMIAESKKLREMTGAQHKALIDVKPAKKDKKPTTPASRPGTK